MMPELWLLCVCFAGLTSKIGFAKESKDADKLSRCNPTDRSIYDFKVKNLEEDWIGLDKYRGQVVLVVNVATYCGYTSQYLDFNALLDKYANRGLTILGFPCNQFGSQEPAENHQILQGLKNIHPGNGYTPHPKLHIFGKLEVNGGTQSPFYEFLKHTCPPTIEKTGSRSEATYSPAQSSDISWNFEKFLVDKEGVPRYRFHTTNWVGGTAVEEYIEKLLAEKSVYDRDL